MIVHFQRRIVKTLMEAIHVNATKDIRKTATNVKVIYFVSICQSTYRYHFKSFFYQLRNYELFISDINECEANIAGCSQICENADGGYSCGCYFGFTLDDDRSHCIQGLNFHTYLHILQPQMVLL